MCIEHVCILPEHECVYVAVETSPRMASFHAHGEIELALLQSGAVSFLFNDTLMDFPLDRLVVYWGAFPHRVVRTSPDARLYVATFQLADLMQWTLPRQVEQALLNGEILSAGQSAREEGDAAMFDRWTRLALNSDDQNARKILLLEMEARLRRFALDQRAAPQRSSYKQQEKGTADLRVLSYIVQNFREPLTIKQIAAAVCMHEKYIMALFKQRFGVSVHRYIIHLRLAHAKRDLILSEAGVATIALNAGFSSLSSFYEAFRKEVKCTPQEFARTHRSPLAAR